MRKRSRHEEVAVKILLDESTYISENFSII